MLSPFFTFSLAEERSEEKEEENEDVEEVEEVGVGDCTSEILSVFVWVSLMLISSSKSCQSTTLMSVCSVQVCTCTVSEIKKGTDIPSDSVVKSCVSMLFSKCVNRRTQKGRRRNSQCFANEKRNTGSERPEKNLSTPTCCSFKLKEIFYFNCINNIYYITMLTDKIN